MSARYPVIISPATPDHKPAVTDKIYHNVNWSKASEAPVLDLAKPETVANAPLESLYYVFEYEGFGGCTMAVSCLMCIPQNTHIFGMVNNRVGEKLLNALRQNRTAGGTTSM